MQNGGKFVLPSKNINLYKLIHSVLEMELFLKNYFNSYIMFKKILSHSFSLPEDNKGFWKQLTNDL